MRAKSMARKRFLMLARELALAKDRPLLKKIIFVIAPVD